MFTKLTCTLLLLLYHLPSIGQQQKWSYKEGFENCLPCREDLNLGFCPGWEQTRLSRVFIASECNDGIPYNAFGTQYPFEGKAHAILHVIDDARNVYIKEGGDKTAFLMRQYMRLILRQPLVHNQKYTFSCYLSLAEHSTFSVDHLFIDVSTQRLKPERSHTPALKPENAFPLSGGVAMRDTINWNKVSTDFVAKGGEKFVTIGLFTGELKFSDYMKLLQISPKSTGNGCNYFIDYVEIKEL